MDKKMPSDWPQGYRCFTCAVPRCPFMWDEKMQFHNPKYEWRCPFYKTLKQTRSTHKEERMDKPKEKRMIGITSVFNNENTKSIHFECIYPHIVEQLKEYGVVYWAPSERPRGMLDVSSCYNFNEVLKYIKALGKEKPKEKKLIEIRWTKEDHPHVRLQNEHNDAIGFHCTDPKIIDQLRSLGKIYHWANDNSDWAYLVVDNRYAYNEVLQYMREYPNRKKPKQGSWPFPLKKKVDRRYATGSAASMCFSCKLRECPYRWNHKMNILDEEFALCPFRERLEE